MVSFNPEKKRAYDKQRYSKQKEEYIKLNPYYIPVRTQQRLKREALLGTKETNSPNITADFMTDLLLGTNI